MYRRNEQFLRASQKHYKNCHGPKQYDPFECKDTCKCKDTCSKDKCCDSCEYDVCKDHNTPQTIIDVLCSLINEPIQVTTPFGVITGTLLDVKSDYIVILEDTGAQVLVRTGKIESVSPIT